MHCVMFTVACRLCLFQADTSDFRKLVLVSEATNTVQMTSNLLALQINIRAVLICHLEQTALLLTLPQICLWLPLGHAGRSSGAVLSHEMHVV